MEPYSASLLSPRLRLQLLYYWPKLRQEKESSWSSQVLNYLTYYTHSIDRLCRQAVQAEIKPMNWPFKGI